MESVNKTDVDTIERSDGIHLSMTVVGDRMSVMHYRIEPGAVVPEHSHHFEQAGYVIRGEGRFESPDGEDVLSEGDAYMLESDEPHSLENVGDTVLEGIDIFSPPRTEL